jgi:hypothetical protein
MEIENAAKTQGATSANLRIIPHNPGVRRD